MNNRISKYVAPTKAGKPLSQEEYQKWKESHGSNILLDSYQRIIEEDTEIIAKQNEVIQKLEARVENQDMKIRKLINRMKNMIDAVERIKTKMKGENNG